MSTSLVKIIVLDQSSGNVIILTAEHDHMDDMEVCVFEAYERFNDENDQGIYLKDSQCSWMQIEDDLEFIYD